LIRNTSSLENVSNLNSLIIKINLEYMENERESIYSAAKYKDHLILIIFKNGCFVFWNFPHPESEEMIIFLFKSSNNKSYQIIKKDFFSYLYSDETEIE